MALRKICGIYLIVSPTGRRYIGSSNDIAKRWCKYKNLLCTSQLALYNSFVKHGVGNHKFEVIYECNVEEIYYWERVFGDIYLSLHTYGGLNMNLPSLGDKRTCISEETRKKHSERSIRVHGTPEAKAKRSALVKVIFNTPEAKKHNSERTKKRFENPEERRKASERAKKQFSTVEARIANSERMKKHFSNPEERKKASERTKLSMANNPEMVKRIAAFTKERLKDTANHPMSKKVINIETNEVFSSVKDAALSINMNPNILRSRVSGRTPNNTIFRFL